MNNEMESDRCKMRTAERKMRREGEKKHRRKNRTIVTIPAATRPLPSRATAQRQRPAAAVQTEAAGSGNTGLGSAASEENDKKLFHLFSPFNR